MFSGVKEHKGENKKNNEAKKMGDYGKDCWRVGGGRRPVDQMTIERAGVRETLPSAAPRR